MIATLHTNHGDININLFPNQAPKTVDNFVGLAKGTKEYKDDAGRTNPQPYYDGLTFHRIIPGFMIQGGCPLGVGMRQMGSVGKEHQVHSSPDRVITQILGRRRQKRSRHAVGALPSHRCKTVTAGSIQVPSPFGGR